MEMETLVGFFTNILYSYKLIYIHVTTVWDNERDMAFEVKLACTGILVLPIYLWQTLVWLI